MIIPIIPTYDQPDPEEWQTDENGRRYRMIGDIKEYEMMIKIDGIEIPQSQLTEFHERRRAAEQARKEAEKNKPAPRPDKSCPFASGLATQCEQDKCALYMDGCIIAQNSNKPPKATEGMRCPFNTYHTCRTDCALYTDGCALTAIIKKARVKK